MKYVIIGAVAGGASTGARLRRMDEQAEIVMFERGAYVSYANCGLPYYIGNVIKDRNKLFVQTVQNNQYAIHYSALLIRATKLLSQLHIGLVISKW